MDSDITQYKNERGLIKEIGKSWLLIYLKSRFDLRNTIVCFLC